MFSKNDLYFALLLAFFLEWGEVLMMPGLTWPNVGHVALRYALLALMLEAVFFLLQRSTGMQRSTCRRRHSASIIL